MKRPYRLAWTDPELEPRLAPSNTPPELVRDLNTADGIGALPRNLMEVNGTLYFIARSQNEGFELWKSDGTSAGTALVRDIRPGPPDSGISDLTNFGSTLYFLANNGTDRGLWKSDGTSAGTQLVRQHNGFPSSPPVDLNAINGKLVYTVPSGGGGLWASDGTSSGTANISSINSQWAYPGSSPGLYEEMNNVLYFRGLNAPAPTGLELYRTNGTASGTFLVSDIYSAPYQVLESKPSGLTNLNGTLLFGATTSAGVELWRSGGGGASQVKDINPTGSSSPSIFATVGGRAILAADDGVNGRELWASDGTSSGTILLQDITAGAASSTLYGLTASGSEVYFRVHTGGNVELWKSDGTPGGTVKYFALDPGSPALSGPRGALLNGKVYFSGAGGGSGEELWATDGTSAGTTLVRDISPGGNSFPREFFTHNGRVYFSASDGASNGLGTALWATDGTSSGTVLVRDIDPSNLGSEPNSITVVGSNIFFTANSPGSGIELWKSDGTSAGTALVRDIRTGAADSNPAWLTNVGGVLYFSANDGASGRELWKSDGTSSGTVRVQDINDGSTTSYPSYLTNVGGLLYFSASTIASGQELWRSNGTSSGTVQVADIAPGFFGSDPKYLTNVNGTVLFSANGANGAGSELWRSNGTSTGTVMVRDIRPGSGSAFYIPSPSSILRPRFTALDGVLYFAARDSAVSLGLYRSDGTSAGTTLVRSFGFPQTFVVQELPRDKPFAVMNGNLYFAAIAGEGMELWRSNGTPSGTTQVRDILPGAGSSIYGLVTDKLPAVFTVAGNVVYFAADDGVSGYELWRSDGTSSGTTLVRDQVPGANGSSPDRMVNVAGALYYRAFGNSANELWRSDGTSGGTALIDLELQSEANPANLTAVGDRLFFSGHRLDVNRELFALREVPALVTGLSVNSGDAQRSRITTITVNFDASLDVALFQNPGAVTLTRTAGGPGTVVTIGIGLVITPGAGNSNSITLTFQNASLSGVENGSLADGRWQLAIPSLGFASGLNDVNLRRLFGDANADGTVDATDFGSFGAAFGGASVAFDFDNNGTIDAGDFGQFGARFGVTL